MSEKCKKSCKYLNYVEHFPILASTVTGCLSIFAFASLVAILVSITSSAIELKICAITAGFKNYNSIIKKKKKRKKKLDYLINPTFRNINRFFVLSFKTGKIILWEIRLINITCHQ